LKHIVKRGGFGILNHRQGITDIAMRDGRG
jgi:hypothetical protein